MDGLMALNPFKNASSSPYTKRIAQGAGRGSLAGARQGFLATGSPVGSIIGGLKGGIEGALMARPGEDEKQLRARMRRLERGVLGDEEAAIMGRFVDPVAAAANEQMVRSRAVAPATAATGAQAREAIAGQRAARRDIGEAAREGGLSVMDLEEQRRMQAQRIREGLKDYEDFRERRYEDFLRDEGEKYAEEVGTARALERLKGEDERRYLAGMSPMMASVLGLMGGRGGQATGPRNAADISAISDEELDAFQLGGGLAPPTRADIEARTPAIEAGLAGLGERTGLGGIGAEQRAPGSREALGAGLEARGTMFQPEAGGMPGAVVPDAPSPVSFRSQRDLDRAEDVAFLFGTEAGLEVLKGNDPEGLLDMPESEYRERIQEQRKQMDFRRRMDDISAMGIEVDDEDKQFIYDADDQEYMDFLEIQGLGGGVVNRLGD